MIPSEGADKIRSWFDSFASGFFGDNEGINREIRERIRHSKAVAVNIRNIFQRIPEEDRIIPLILLETAALLHDVGRFNQTDEREDHAEQGINLLKERNVLNGFSKREKELVYLSIFYHNRKGAHLQCDDNEVIAISEFLRRADKLDILRNR